MNTFNRTDLAPEIAARSGLTVEESTIHGIKTTRVVITAENAEKCQKPPGNYVTLHCDERNAKAEISVLSQILSKMLSNVLGKPLLTAAPSVLVAGLGNPNITPDSLGVAVAAKTLATAHFYNPRDTRDTCDGKHDEYDELGLNRVYVLRPGVMAQTGLESAQQLRYAVSGLNLSCGGVSGEAKQAVDCVIVVDSLACSERERLARTIQVTDTGIAPGSGVQNKRKEISAATLGVPVIAIGVPTVIDWHSPETPDAVPFMVVPRDIDSVIAHYARVIGAAINSTLNPELTEEEVAELLSVV